MKRSSVWTLAAAAALLTAAGAYLLTFALGRLRPGPETAPVRACVWQEELPLQCVVIRSEQQIGSPREHARLTAGRGERLPAGAALAVAYDTAQEYLRSALLLRLRREAETIRAGAALPAGSLRSRVSALSAAAVRRDFEALNSAALALSLGLLPGDAQRRDTGALEAEIAALEAAGGRTGLVCVPGACFFSPDTDGWEGLAPWMAAQLTADDLQEVISAPPRISGALGKAVTDSTWLLAALTGAEEASRFAPGDPASLLLEGTELSCEVIQVRAQADGRGVIIFRCTAALARFLDVRVVTAAAVTDRAEGLLLPAGALREDETGFFVWRLASPFLRREAVTVVRTLPEGVLVSAPGLRPGSRVLLTEGDYHDGMLL